MKSAARRRIKRTLSWTVALLTLSYGVGDHFGLWDALTARTAAARGVVKMGSARGLGETLLCSPDSEFSATLAFIIRRSESPESAKLAAGGVQADCMTSISGSGQVLPLPPEWPASARLAPHSPVVVMYNVERAPEGGYRGRHGNLVKAHWAARLDDISGWIDRDRNNERFTVTTAVLGLLSVTLLLIEPKSQ